MFGKNKKMLENMYDKLIDMDYRLGLLEEKNNLLTLKLSDSIDSIGAVVEILLNGSTKKELSKKLEISEGFKITTEEAYKNILSILS